MDMITATAIMAVTTSEMYGISLTIALSLQEIMQDVIP